METSVPLITLEQIYRAIVEVKVVTDSVDSRLRILNGTVRQHAEDLAVLKDWRATQANRAITQVGDLKVELAKIGAFGGGFGLIAAITAAIGKAIGVY